MTLGSSKAIIKFLANPYILIILILAPITFWVYLNEFYPQAKPNSDAFYTVPRKKPLFTNQKQQIQKQADLTKVIDLELAKLDGDYAVIVKDLTSKITYSKNETRAFASASIYKLAIMYKVYDAVENKELSLAQEIAPGLTTQKALELMITVSDNDSALALAEKVGWKNAQNTLEKDGVIGFDLNRETPTVNAAAASALLEKVYRNEAVSPDASKKMKELLLAQQINDRIPRFLPTDVKVAHKTGELDNIRHDAGIVFGKKSDYIFIILSETPAPGIAVDKIANLSKTIFYTLEP